MLRRRWVLLAATALVAVAATTAHAAILPLTSRTLYGLKSSADAMPALLVTDPFTNPTAVNLDNRPASTGQLWDVALGTLQVTGTQLRCTNCAGGNYGAAFVDADLPQVTATVSLRRNGTTGTPGAAGLVMNANVTGTQAIVVWWDTSVVTLFRYVGGGLTQLAQANSAGISSTADRPLVVTYSAGTYSVSFNGVPLFTNTLSAADQTTFGANTYFGVVFNDDPDLIRLDNCEVKR
jgi:hypothetical protein